MLASQSAATVVKHAKITLNPTSQNNNSFDRISNRSSISQTNYQ